MIEPQLYLAFLAASVALMLLPGPNVALITANSIAHGTRFGLLTVAGTSSAMVLQLSLTALGLTALMDALAQGFEWIRWLGVVYLVYLGLRLWRAPPAALAAAPLPPGQIYARGLLVSLTNPKVLLFYGAFFPQFVTPGEGAGTQFALLALTFLATALVIDTLWAVLAGRARPLLAGGRWQNRLTGALLIGAGIGLALARRR